MNEQIAQANKEKCKAYFLKEGSLSKNAIAALMGNIYDESGFIPRTENLNFITIARLREVWPKIFNHIPDAEIKVKYIKNPVNLANLAYAHLGGYAFIGRGLIQITGKANYTYYGKLAGVDILTDCNKANDIDVAMKIALAYIKDRAFPLAKKKFGKDLNSLTIDQAALVITMAIQGEAKNYNTPALKEDMAQRVAYANSVLKTL